MEEISQSIIRGKNEVKTKECLPAAPGCVPGHWPKDRLVLSYGLKGGQRRSKIVEMIEIVDNNELL